MTAAAVALAVACQLFLVTGQILLKRAMKAAPIRFGSLAAGIGLLTAWFFSWLSLLAHWDLSRIYPFEGLNPVLVVIGAWLFLKERVPATAWIAIAMISAGVVLASGS